MSYYKVTEGNKNWTVDSSKCHTYNNAFAGEEFLPKSGLIILFMNLKTSSIVTNQDTDEKTRPGNSKAD